MTLQCLPFIWQKENHFQQNDILMQHKCSLYWKVNGILVICLFTNVCRFRLLHNWWKQGCHWSQINLLRQQESTAFCCGNTRNVFVDSLHTLKTHHCWCHNQGRCVGHSSRQLLLLSRTRLCTKVRTWYASIFTVKIASDFCYAHHILTSLILRLHKEAVAALTRYSDSQSWKNRATMNNIIEAISRLEQYKVTTPLSEFATDYCL